MNENPTFMISFDDPDQAQAGTYAQELSEVIRDRAPQARVTTLRENPNSQDLGTMIAVAAGGMAVRAVFEAVRIWLMMRRKPIQIKVGEKVFIIEELTPDMQAEITKVLLPPPAEKKVTG